MSGFLSDLLLPVVALGDFAGVHDHRQRTLAGDAGRLDLHVDRQGLLDRRVHPAARAEAIGAAQHDQARAKVVRVAFEQLLLFLGERVLGDIGEDHAIVRLEAGDIGGQGIAGDDAGAADSGGEQAW